MNPRAQRAAENENLFRRVNERVEELSGGLETLTLVCECADTACAERLVDVPVSEYEDVRAHGDRFFVAPGHEQRDVESIVSESKRYLVVEKRGAAGEVARQNDPRDQ